MTYIVQAMVLSCSYPKCRCKQNKMFLIAMPNNVPSSGLHVTVVQALIVVGASTFGARSYFVLTTGVALQAASMVTHTVSTGPTGIVVSL
jgi:hypothetical protein